MRREYLLWGVALTLVVAMAYAFFLVFAPFFRAIAWALILAILLAPAHHWLARWVPRGGPRAALTCVLAALLLLGPVLTVGSFLVAELAGGFRTVQAAAESGAIADFDPRNWAAVAWVRDTVEAWVAPYLPDFTVDRYLDFERLNLQATVASVAQELSQWLLGQTGSALSNLADLTFTVVIIWLTLFYLLRDGEALLGRAIELLPYPDAQKDAMLSRLNGVVVSSVYGGMAVALAQGALGGIAFAIVRLPSPVLWGTVMAALSFLPLVGSALVWGPAAIVLVVQGRWIAAIFIAGWGMLVIGLVDNLLRPVLISGRTRMHPLAVFFAVVGGIKAFGFLGLFLGPVLVAGVAGVLELYRGVVRGEYGEDLREKVAPDPEPEPGEA